MHQYHAALGRFGLDRFRDTQIPILDATWAGDDVLAVMPTGAGKSLCFQLPALFEDGITIVISPLLALMRDQLYKLQAQGIPAFHISSAQSDEENHQNLAALRQAKNGLFYISPEQLAKGSLQYWLKDLTLARLVVDEAHCFSQWGHDFRPDYRHIPAFVNKYPSLRLSAFTATASKRVVADLAQHLFMGRKPQIFIHPPMRENISISFVRKNNPRAQLLDAIRKEPTIIYAATRSKTEVLAKAIRDAGFNATHYHAGLETDERRAIEQAFLQETMPIIVATNAFGMGVDHTNLRTIIHADMPASIEAYVQEIGRAGRDGKPARALMLFGEDDYEIRKEQIETSVSDEIERAQQMALLDALFDLANQGAGWAEINAYFIEDTSWTHIHHQETDPLNLLKRWRYTQAQRLKIPPYWVLPDDVLSRIADKKPLNIDALAQIKGMGDVRLGKYGASILEALGASNISTSKARRDVALQGHGDIFERLSACARELRYGANGCEKPMDCPASLITRIVKSRPQSQEKLALIQGMTPERLERFGDAFILELVSDSR